jgi:cell wall-associated NlpC family hydrolase
MDSKIASFVGVPFLPHGRTLDGCDCYGLVRLVLWDVYGKLLPRFEDGYTDFDDKAVEARLIQEKLSAIEATKLDAPEEGCVVVLRYLGAACHIGIMVDTTHVLHTEPERMSHIEALTSVHIASRVEGFYRVD